jgi:hypothetical protein
MRGMRRWLRTESVGITVPVGVVLGWAVHQVFWGIGTGLMTPYWRSAGEAGWERFVITILGVTIDTNMVIPPLIGAVLLLALLSILFLWPLRDDDVDALAPDHRECPHCRSEIRADASRCAFCAEPVDPLDAEPVAAAVE